MPSLSYCFRFQCSLLFTSPARHHLLNVSTPSHPLPPGGKGDTCLRTPVNAPSFITCHDSLQDRQYKLIIFDAEVVLLILRLA